MKKQRMRLMSLMLCLAVAAQLLPVSVLAAEAGDRAAPEVATTRIPWQKAGANGEVEEVTVEQYRFTFSHAPETAEELAQYRADSPYAAMALLLLAFRTWTPEDPSICEKMLDQLTDTRAPKPGGGENYAFSEYNAWKDFLAQRMKQNSKYRYIGNAYLEGASPENDYTPDEPFVITLRESTYVPFAAATETTPALWQVLVHPGGSDSERYALFYEDGEGTWKVWGDSWQGLLADVQTPWSDILMPPVYERPAEPANPQVEPEVEVRDVPAQAAGVDDYGNPIVLDTTVKEYSFTFSTVPTCYEDIVQYELDSPYKTMALLFLALRTWTPANKTDCHEMLDYLTNTAVDSWQTDAEGHKLSRKFSQYQFWTDFLRDRMMQNEKYRFIGNAYLNGATPANDYTPTLPITITVRQSVYDPFKPSNGHLTDPSLRQVLVSLAGDDNDRYSLFYQDQRGDWRVFGDNWMGLLADVKEPEADSVWPAEVVRSETPAVPQTEPELTVREVPAYIPAEDGGTEEVTVQEYTYTFSTIPASYEDIVQYELDSPYKTMALIFLSLRSWTPENPEDCARMLDYLTHPAVQKPGAMDAEGHKLSYAFSEYTPWVSFLKDRMEQNEKYRFIGNSYLNGAAPENNYTPAEPVSITLRQSVYDPFKAGSDTTPELKQVLVSLAGDDNDRYSLFYQDQRGDWRVFGDNWMGLLADVKEPEADSVWPAEVVRSENPADLQVEPELTVREVPAYIPAEDGGTEEVTVQEYTYTFSTIPASYEDIVQYELDSPYKTMALIFLALRSWTPENPEDCARMLDYLTHPAVQKPGAVDAEGHKLSYAFSEYTPWVSFLKDRMEQNEKYRFIGGAYLNGAAPENNYTPTEPVSITLRQSVYDSFKEGSDTTPELKQVLVSLAGDDNDRYSLFYQDQRGDWRVFGDNWMGLLADVKEPEADSVWPAEVVRSETPVNPQVEPELTVREVPAYIPTEDGGTEEVTVQEYTYTFSTIPASYEDIVQYELDSPYKTMALIFLALRSWTPENPGDCARMLDYLTHPAVQKPGAVDAEGHKLSYAFSEYTPWVSFLKDRMEQNEKYRFIGNSYLNGAAPENNYTPAEPVSITLRQSVYDPFKEGSDTTPELKQVLVSLAGDDNDRYSLFYQDQRGDWRVFGDNWMGLLADVKEPGGGDEGGEPRIENAEREAGSVRFTVAGGEGNVLPVVAAYDGAGRMLSVKAPVQAETHGAYTAAVAPGAARVCVFLLDAATLRPLCEAAEL